MLISIDNEAERLGKTVTPEYLPYVVTAYRSATSRSPLCVRRKTFHEARCFVEEITGIYAHRYVNNGTPGDLQCFTGSHAERYSDVKQYRPVNVDALGWE